MCSDTCDANCQNSPNSGPAADRTFSVIDRRPHRPSGSPESAPANTAGVSFRKVLHPSREITISNPACIDAQKECLRLFLPTPRMRGRIPRTREESSRGGLSNGDPRRSAAARRWCAEGVPEGRWQPGALWADDGATLPGTPSPGHAPLTCRLERTTSLYVKFA